MLKYAGRFVAPLFLLWTLPLIAATPAASPAPHRLFRVTLDGASKQVVSGRLLLFATPKAQAEARAKARGGKLTRVDASPFFPTRTAVAAMQVTSIAPGQSVLLDADALAFPKPFSQLDAGSYAVQAVLDVNVDYNYGGRGAGDVVSEVATITFADGHTIPTLVLGRTLTKTFDLWTVPKRVPAKVRVKAQAELDAAHANTRPIDFTSPALSAFWGRPMHIRGWVVLPPGYAEHSESRYPTVYMTHGFGGSLASLTFHAASVFSQMQKGEMPPMIWVLLDESSPRGTHEFADSVNNGPWGKALTSELIPHLEATWRMDGKADGRFLTGHSSGGWATLWLQVRYPNVFGGTWSTAPDPSDFRNFTGADLYAVDANVYVKPDGTANPLVRAGGKVMSTFKQFAELERVLGPVGGQLASFEWVFSPKGDDGRPVPMFDRDTGKVNPDVAHYWRDHYDIAWRIKQHWPELKADLDGKIHVIVGTADTFYLNESAKLLKQVLDEVGAHAEVEFKAGKTHGNLGRKSDNRHWLQQQIAWAMYHRARPKAKIPTAYRHEIDG